MKIISANQICETDAFTIKEKSISSLDLMERAGSICVNRICYLSNPFTKFTVFCGMGNNGGDGLVISRLLAAMHRQVEVYIIHHREIESPEFKANKERLQKQGLVQIKIIQNNNVISMT